MQLARVHSRSLSDATLDLNDLLVFARVAESKSLTAAATDLGLPKSSISRRLAALEERLGVRLIQRTTRKFSLTDIGETYFERCREILSDVTAANKAVTDMQATPTGRLRITAPEDLGSILMGRLIAEFTALHPDITVDLVLTNRIVDLIAESFDVAIRVGFLRESSLIVRRLARANVIFCASPSYLARHGEPTEIEELGEHALALFVPDGFTQMVMTNGERDYGLPTKPQLSSNHAMPVREALLAGLGIGQLPLYVIAEQLAAGTLVQVLPEWSSGEFHVHLLYPARRNLPTRLSLFVEYMLAELDPPPWERIGWKS